MVLVKFLLFKIQLTITIKKPEILFPSTKYFPANSQPSSLMVFRNETKGTGYFSVSQINITALK